MVAAVTVLGPLPSSARAIDQSLDLLRSFVELGDLRVAHHPLDRELVDVAVAAEDLDGVRRDPHRGVAGDEFTHRRPPAGVRRARPRSRCRPCTGAAARPRSAASMSASIAAIIWNSPIGLPNWLALRGVGAPRPRARPGRSRPPGRRSRAGCGRASASRSRSPRPPRRRGSRPGRGRRRSASSAVGRAADAHLVLEPVDAEARPCPSRRRSTSGADAAARPGRSTAKTVTRSATLPWLMNRFEPSMHVVVAVADGPGPGGGASRAGLGLGQGERDRACSPAARSGNQRSFCSSACRRAGAAATPAPGRRGSARSWRRPG